MINSSPITAAPSGKNIGIISLGSRFFLSSSVGSSLREMNFPIYQFRCVASASSQISPFGVVEIFIATSALRDVLMQTVAKNAKLR